MKSIFVQSCACHDRFFHSYCATANIIRSKQIYCPECLQYYHLFIQREKMLTSHNFAQLLKYIFFFILLIVFAIGFNILDTYIKEVTSGTFTTLSVNLTPQAVSIILVLLAIFAWCLSIFFIKTLTSQNKVTSVEVVSYDDDDFGITRFQSKYNMNLVLEQCNMNRGENDGSQFDQRWFTQRSIQYVKSIIEEDATYFNYNREHEDSNLSNE